MNLSVDFLDAVHGTETEISFPHLKKCSVCNGRGHAADAKINTCSTCRGSGRINRIQRTILGAVQTQLVCPDCHGEGKKASVNCSHCHGQGRIKEMETIKVKIPAGINQGESIRLSGYGDAGEKGASGGDLFLRVRINTHHNFKREGDDIHTQAEINIAQAALGDTINIDTVYGNFKLKIPEGTQGQTIFRLKAKGVTHLHGRGQGDHFVRVKVLIPKNLSKKQKDLLSGLNL
jgi:molecular chaperone DnaJ